MLPAKRVTVGELWRLLSGESDVKLDGTAMNGTAPGHPSGAGGSLGRKSGRGKVPPGEKGGYWWSR